MSLIEMMVAILLFSAGALAVLTVTTTSLRSNNDSYAVDESVNLARLHMDRLIGLDYDDGQLLDTNGNGMAGLQAEDAATADYNIPSGRYQVAWNVAENVPVNGAKTLAVIVAWQGNERTRRVAFQTIKSE